MTPSPPALRPAATVMLIRGGRALVPEVLLVNRHRDTAFGSSYAFPGGVVESEDECLAHRCMGLDEGEARRRFASDLPSMSYWVAALRETFEETGILLARRRRKPVSQQQAGELLQLLRRGTSFGALCDQHDLELPLDEVHYIAHWVTPTARPKRFDTRFFLAVWPQGQDVDLDARELTASRWCTAQTALDEVDAGLLTVPRPTAAQLRWFAQFGSLEEAINTSSAMHQQGIPCFRPVVLPDERVVMPGDPGYPAD